MPTCQEDQCQLAKVQEKTTVYLTSCKRCGCPDYRKRRLPCKHMYALAMELDGDMNKCILDNQHPPLYGLTLALAGTFQGAPMVWVGLEPKLLTMVVYG